MNASEGKVDDDLDETWWNMNWYHYGCSSVPHIEWISSPEHWKTCLKHWHRTPVNGELVVGPRALRRVAHAIRKWREVAKVPPPVFSPSAVQPFIDNSGDPGRTVGTVHQVRWHVVLSHRDHVIEKASSIDFAESLARFPVTKGANFNKRKPEKQSKQRQAKQRKAKQSKNEPKTFPG